MGSDPQVARAGEAPAAYHTPTGAPCPRAVRLDGGVEGSGECLGCGTCLQLVDLAWPS